MTTKKQTKESIPERLVTPVRVSKKMEHGAKERVIKAQGRLVRPVRQEIAA